MSKRLRRSEWQVLKSVYNYLKEVNAFKKKFCVVTKKVKLAIYRNFNEYISVIFQMCLTICLVFLLGKALYINVFKSLWAYLALKNNIALQITAVLLSLFGFYRGICSAQKVIDASHKKFLCMVFIVYVYYRFFFDYQDDDYRIIPILWNIDGFALVGFSVVLGFVGRKVYEYFKNYTKKGGAESDTDDLKTIIPIYLDEPIDEEQKDLFHYSNLAKSLAFSICQKSFENSYSIGISSPWGTGKSSFLNLLKKELGEYDNIIIVDFNPRSSANVDCIQADFLSLLASTLAPFHTGMKSAVKDYMEDINVLSSDTSLAKIIGLVHIQDAADSRDKLQMGISDIGKKIVVMIDDLDRLTNSEILEVLKLITKNAAFENTIFITTYDKVYVNGILDKSLVKLDNQQFTDKYFNMEIDLPKGNGEIRSSFLLKEFLKLKNSGHLTACTEQEFRNVVRDESRFIERYLPTLRDVKRFLNTFCAAYIPIQDEVYLCDYLLLSLLRYADKGLYNKIRYRKNLAVIDQYGDKNIYVLLEKERLESKEKDVLSFLFPEQKNNKIDEYNTKGQKHIYWRRSFNTYFYNLEYTNLHQADLSKLLKANIKNQEIKELSIDWKKRNITVDVKDFLVKFEDYQNDQEQLRTYLRLCMICYRYTGERDIFITASRYFYYFNWKQNKKKFKFKDKEEYKKYMSDILMSGSDINAPSVFLQQLLYFQLSENQLKLEDCVFTDDELKNLSLSRLKDGLFELNEKTITGSDVLFLVLSCLDDADPSDSGSYGFKLMPRAKELLKQSILKTPQSYLYHVITHRKEDKHRIQFFLNEDYPYDKIFTCGEMKEIVTNIDVTGNNTLLSACNFWYEYLDYCIAQGEWRPVTTFAGDFNKLKEYNYKQYHLVMEGEPIE